ncbi:MAG: DUF86 domain-containing protein [Deltaproteobacteria bacterium]|nr:MAG: DUF86 domain-containing protein [Deltaproteobacteria bacterium]
MTHKDDQLYLRHILEAIGQIEEYVVGCDEAQFLATRLIQDAVIRQCEIIGEATKNLLPETRNKAADIPWRDIAGMRDKLIHQYFGVDLASVWLTVKEDLPVLKSTIAQLLE